MTQVFDTQACQRNYSKQIPFSQGMAGWMKNIGLMRKLLHHEIS
jgi:hypothetical protein